MYNFYFKGGWWYITFWELYIQIINKYIWIFLTTLHFNLYTIEIIFDREVDVDVSIFPLFAFTDSFCVCCVLLINFRIPIDCSGLSVWLSVCQMFSILLFYIEALFFLLKSCEVCTQTFVPCFWCRFKVNTLDGMRNSEKVGVCSQNNQKIATNERFVFCYHYIFLLCVGCVEFFMCP